MDIRIIAVGKVKDYYQKAIDEYFKRIKPFSKIDIIEVKESTTQDIDKNMQVEAKAILSNINDNDYIITLEIEGKLIDSIEFSEFLYQHYLYSDRAIKFIIGGSNGLGEDILKRSNYQLSFGKFTYPHQLIRVILIEQIYRAIMINNNSKYHK